jgi:hypothetical protein
MAMGAWGQCPQLKLAFSFEEAPTFGRGSSLDSNLAEKIIYNFS